MKLKIKMPYMGPLLSIIAVSQEAVKTDKNGYPVFYRAAEDAKIKAGVLAKAAGIHIGELVHIDFSWGKVDFEVRPVQDVCFESCGMAPAGGISMDIEPDDMEAEDTVTVVWDCLLYT